MKTVAKCQCCKTNPHSWIWQPELDSWCLPGSHYRGFATIKLCDECRERYEDGEIITIAGTAYRHTPIVTVADVGVELLNKYKPLFFNPDGTGRI